MVQTHGVANKQHISFEHRPFLLSSVRSNWKCGVWGGQSSISNRPWTPKAAYVTISQCLKKKASAVLLPVVKHKHAPEHWHRSWVRQCQGHFMHLWTQLNPLLSILRAQQWGSGNDAGSVEENKQTQLAAVWTIIGLFVGIIYTLSKEMMMGKFEGLSGAAAAAPTQTRGEHINWPGFEPTTFLLWGKSATLRYQITAFFMSKNKLAKAFGICWAHRLKSYWSVWWFEFVMVVELLFFNVTFGCISKVPFPQNIRTERSSCCRLIGMRRSLLIHFNSQ